MPLFTKRSALFFLLLSLISILLLAATLPRMQLHAGSPFPGSAGSQDDINEVIPRPPGANLSLPITQGVFALIFLILVIYVLVRLISHVDIGKIVGPLTFLVIVFVILGLLRLSPSAPVSPAEEYVEIPPAASTAYPVSPLGEPPQAFTWLVLAGIATGLVILAVAISKWAPARASTKEKFQQEASRALDALEAGQAFKDVIIRCYMQMTRVLQEEQGMERRAPMTVREFERLLMLKGIPATPVRQLTRLFEEVRYGKQPASAQDQELGIGCLQEIVRYCQVGRV